MSCAHHAYDPTHFSGGGEDPPEEDRPITIVEAEEEAFAAEEAEEEAVAEEDSEGHSPTESEFEDRDGEKWVNRLSSMHIPCAERLKNFRRLRHSLGEKNCQFNIHLFICHVHKF